MGLFGSIGDAFSDGLHAVEDGADWVKDRAEDAAGWVGDHWKQIAVIGTAVVVGTVVTIATGGAGAPLLVALAAGGFAGGASADVVGSLLDGESVSPLHVLKAGAISTVITVGTFGLGKLATPAIARILTPGATRAIATSADSLPGAATSAAGSEVAQVAPAAAGEAFAGLDAQTARVIEEYGLTPETKLYRVADPQFVDLANGQVAGNPRSIALVQDPYAPKVEHPLSVIGRQTNPEYPPIMIPQTVAAKELGPTLNVSTVDPSAYAKAGFVKLELSLGDVLASGGRIYRDVGANLNHAYIVTVPETLPLRGVSAPAGGSLEGLPLPGVASGPGLDIDKVETYVRTSLKTGASAGTHQIQGGDGPHGGGGSAPAPPSRGPGLVGKINGTNH